MFTRYVRFIQAISVNRLGQLGVAFTTSSFITFLFLEMARFSGVLSNAYIGLITYLLLPALFLFGLLLIPLGWHQQKKETGKTTRELLDAQFRSTDTARGFFGSKVFLSIGALTLVNIVFLGLASSRMLIFMDEPNFCGTACHSVMNPEWVTYQESPHARVRCVECHVGEGVEAHISSKLSGLRQMISVTFDLLERPIPTPVRDLRPSRETCEKCHWPEKFYGQRLKTIVRYKKDVESTALYNTLSLKIDAGKGAERRGIHWHVSEENEVRYASVDDEREKMIWVEARQPDGDFKRYTNTRLVGHAEASLERTLDCVDCHNRATHIYEDPNNAIDERMSRGMIDRSLPFVKRESMAAITAGYANEEDAMEGISNRLHGFYRREFPEVARGNRAGIDSVVTVLQAVYTRNIHHQMNITWNTYRSLIGHSGGGGCFRCHNANMVDDGGEAISSDCTMCHSILAYESDAPFAYVQTADSTAADFRMHEYLLKEFLDSSKK